MNTLSNKDIAYLSRCIDKNVELLDKNEDSSTIETLTSIKDRLNDNEFSLHFKLGVEHFEAVDECLITLKELSEIYSSLIDLNLLIEYDGLKKRIISALEYLSTLKDLFIDEALFLEDVLKKEIRAKLIVRIMEEKGVAFTNAKELVFGDDRYAKQLKNLRPYLNYTQITKTKYDLYSKMFQAILQSVSIAGKEKNMSYTN